MKQLWYSARAAVRRTFGSLDTHNYRLYFFGDLVSHIGGWMQTMAEAWLVLTLTHNGVAVGATFAFRFLPVLLFGLWGGTIADRFDRRKLLLLTQTLPPRSRSRCGSSCSPASCTCGWCSRSRSAWAS